MTRTGPSTQAQAGILKALVSSTLVKDLVRLKMGSLRPDSGRNAVQTLMGTDPEVLFGIVGSVPAMVNSMLSALTELAVVLKKNHPPELLKSFTASLAGDIDRVAARECTKAWVDLASTMLEASPELRANAVRAILNGGPKLKAGAINAFSRLVNGITRDDPEFLGRFVSEVIRGVDGLELGKASAAIANAFLDQKWGLASWTWSLVKGRVKRRFGR